MCTANRTNLVVDENNRSQLTAGYSNKEAKKGKTMNSNTYETAEVLELGRAQNTIRGMKVMDPLAFDFELGTGWRWIEADIDESDE